MRAPADSTKPITGTRERSASSSTATTVSACASPSEPPANEASCANTATARPSTRPLAPSTPSPGRAFSPMRRESTSVRSRSSEPGSQSTSRRSSGVSRSSGRGTSASVMLPPDRARCCGRRSRTSWRSRSPRAPSASASARARSGHVVEVELGVGLLEAERRRDQPRPQREDRRDRLDRAGGAEQVPDRGLGRRDRDPWRVLAERRLQRDRLGAVVERRRGAVGVDVDDVLRVDAARPRARA